MRLIFRAHTTMGPRTVVAQGLDADTAHTLAASLEGSGCAVSLGEDGSRTSWSEHFEAWKEAKRQEARRAALLSPKIAAVVAAGDVLDFSRARRGNA